MAGPDSERAHFHRFAVALTADQVEHVKEKRTLLRTWFGNGKSVPVKNDVKTVVEAFFRAKKELPAAAILFCLPLLVYRDWLHEGEMLRCDWVGGYRIYRDINLSSVDAALFMPL